MQPLGWLIHPSSDREGSIGQEFDSDSAKNKKCEVGAWRCFVSSVSPENTANALSKHLLYIPHFHWGSEGERDSFSVILFCKLFIKQQPTFSWVDDGFGGRYCLLSVGLVFRQWTTGKRLTQIAKKRKLIIDTKVPLCEIYQYANFATSSTHFQGYHCKIVPNCEDL